MGEKKKGGDGDSKKKDEKTPITVVLKVDMHCEGCASKIVRCVRGFEGVETVKAETDANKLTVNGVVDPSKIREKLQHKTKKKVDLISPQPKKDNNNNNNNSKDSTKQENNKKSDDKKTDNDKRPKEAPVTTAVLKLGLHCHGCIEKIHKTVTKTKGVLKISIDKQKELVTVKGTMDVKALTEVLKEKFKRPVEIVPPKKENENGNGGENQAGGGNEGGKKKKGGGGDDGHEGGGGNQMEGNKMEYIGQPVYIGQPGFGYEYGYGYGYGPVGYPVQLVHAPQTFNDENPNACYIM